MALLARAVGMRRGMAVLPPLMLLVSGCVQEVATEDEEADVGVPAPPLLEAPTFSIPKLIDPLRAGGEPVIAVTPTGAILVASHPGYTHWHPDVDAVPPTGAELAAPTQAQSYLWRSADGGATWEHVTLLPVKGLPNSGPRGVGQGVSDPDLTVDGNGRIWLTDLEALAEASVSWSDDDGKTWLMGNNLASGGQIDRQWLASHGGTLYFTGNYFTDHRILTTQDGLTYERVGDVPCSGDLVADPRDGTLYAGCGDGVALSQDGGRTWTVTAAPVGVASVIGGEPALDSAGTLYLPGRADGNAMALAWSPDQGRTWANISLKAYFPELVDGTWIWPWVSAGSPGRAAVTFFASPTKNAQRSPEADWFVYAAILVNATNNATREVHALKLTPTPFHHGGMCQSGTTCQATTAVDENSDRRLGDFFETTIDRDGFLHVVYADTQTKPSDSVSHVGYVRQTGGVRLIDGPMPTGYPLQG